MSRVAGCAVVDADGHVVELPTMWPEYLEEPFRGREPRFVVGEGGRPALMLDRRPVGTVAVQLASGPDGEISGTPRRAGGWDAKARLVDMDADGVDAAVLFPSLAFFVCEAEDPALDEALCRAYNDWLADYCRAAPERLHGVALLPLRDVAASVRELERCVERYGFRGAFVRPNPYAGRPVQDPAYEPFWQCAESLGVPLTVHEGLSDGIPTLGRDRASDRGPGRESASDPSNPALLHVFSHAFEQMAACAGLLMTGVLERHPRLRVAFLESGSGWLPYWLQRLDSHYDTWRRWFPALRARPSEIFRRQCFISCEPDDEVVRSVLEHVGDECVVWASDYPHPDAHFPGCVEKTLETLRGVSDESRARLLGTNALRLYGLAAG